MKRSATLSIIFLSILTLLTLALITLVVTNSRQSSVVIEWSTASELDTVGFNIYRAETENDFGVQVNPQLIPASTDVLTGGDYQFMDTTVQPGRTYYYWLEDVDAAGATGRNGPIEVRANANLWLEWLLTFGLVIVLAWGWISLLLPHKTIPSAQILKK